MALDAFRFFRGGAIGDRSFFDFIQPFIVPALVVSLAAPVLAGLLAGNTIGNWLGTYEEQPENILRRELADEYRRQISRLKSVKESRSKKEKAPSYLFM